MTTYLPELLFAVDPPRVLCEAVVEEVCYVYSRISPGLLLQPVDVGVKRCFARGMLCRDLVVMPVAGFRQQ